MKAKTKWAQFILAVLLAWVWFGYLTVPAFSQCIYKYHEVAPGETVYSIATKYHTSVEELLRCNSKTITDLHGLQIGSILMVPYSADEPAFASSPSKTSKCKASNQNSSKVKVASSNDSSSKSVSTAKIKRGHSRRSLASNYGTSPSTATSSDGTSVKIPTYVSPEPEDDYRSSLSSRSGRPIRNLLSHARRFMGVPYVWGGTSPQGFDCSGYVQYVYNLVGVDLPRTADVQYNCGRAVVAGLEAPGDMVFFEPYDPGASHVGIYLGGGEFIHASSVGYVRVSRLDEEYFRQHYLGAKRVL